MSIEYRLIRSNLGRGRDHPTVKADVLPKVGDMYEVREKGGELERFYVKTVVHRLLEKGLLENDNERTVENEVYVSPLEELE